MNKASQMAGMIAEADRYSRIVEEFPPQDRILSRILERQTNRYRERVLLKCGDVQWTYNETFAIAGQWAQRLSEAGVAGGDRVAIICGNRPEFCGRDRGETRSASLPVLLRGAGPLPR